MLQKHLRPTVGHLVNSLMILASDKTGQSRASEFEMNIYDDVVDASRVSCAVRGHFTRLDQEELVLAKTNIISVYAIQNNKLVIEHEFKISGKIHDMVFVPQQHSKLNCLVLSTGKAKLSIVRFNDSVPTQLETLSLHYYEAEFAKKSILELTKASKLRFTPGNKMLLIFNNDCLAILPLLGMEEEDEDAEETLKPKKKQKLEPSSSQNSSAMLAGPSTILNFADLHSDIMNVIDVQFLNSFNNATLAVLFQPRLAWCGNEKIVGDMASQLVAITLNIGQGLGTTIFHQTKLPSDLHTVVSLSGSVLLLGTNEIISMDNTGTLQACIEINSFSPKHLAGRQINNRPLEIFLEAPTVSTSLQVNGKNHELTLIMSHSGDMLGISSHFEGRLLSDFSITKLPIVNHIFNFHSIAACMCLLQDISNLRRSVLFMGFNSGDALLLELNNLKYVLNTRQEVMVEAHVDEDEDYDALYGDEVSTQNGKIDRVKILESDAPFNIEVLDRIVNLAPITSIALGKVCSLEKTKEGLPNPNREEKSLIVSSGNGEGSHLNIINPSVEPLVQQALKFTSVTQIWNLRVRNKDKYLVTTDSGASKSDIFEISKKFTLLKPKHFKRNVTTVEIAMIGNGKRIIQVTTKALYLFNLGFKKLLTISFDFEVIHVSILDPFILLTNSKGEIKIYELDSKHRNKLTKVRLPEALEGTIITSGFILKSTICDEFINGPASSQDENPLFTFVTANNQMIFFTKDHHDKVFQLNGIDCLNENLFISTYLVEEERNPDPSIKQVMIVKLGKEKQEEHLVILSFGGEIYLYRRWHNKFVKIMHRNDILITGAPNNAYSQGTSTIERIVHYIPSLNGYSVILITGRTPYIIIKENGATPKIFKFGNIPLVSLTLWGQDSVMCVDDIKNARIVTIDNSYDYSNRLPIKRIRIEDILDRLGTLGNVAYHERTETFIVSYTKCIPYSALSEEGERLVGYKEGVPHAKSFKSGILLLNPRTWNIIDKVEYDDNVLVNDIKTMMIQLNSRTKRKREYIVVGTACVRDEDIGTMGSFHLYDVTEVVPEPGKPDTNFKLKSIFSEEFRGAVSNVCEISGRFLISQSQKVLVRDVQEDNSVVPVAFLDVPVFVTDCKSFSNLLAIGDSMQGVQFVGFDAEPYRMIPLGRSGHKFEVKTLEFLVNNGDVFFLLSDRNDILHVLKYAPDEPHSISGQKLVHCTSFNMHSSNNAMKLLLKNEEFAPFGQLSQSYQAVGGQMDGSIFKVLPLSESSYRRLYVVQQQLIDKEIQCCGLNPKMERLQNEFYHKGHVMRPLLDFTVIKSFCNLPLPRRNQVISKVGRQAQTEVWRDLIDVEYSLRSLS